MYLSVILCTHNPRSDYLGQVLNALKRQSLSYQNWELLVVDNKSHFAVQKSIDLSWHPSSVIFREEMLGLVHARIAGICKSKGEVIVFVDDDNVLFSDYLEQVVSISNQYSFLGAWGGDIQGKFEVSPPFWFNSYLGLLGIRDVKRNTWSNYLDHQRSTPCGAGMCIRRVVALKYLELVKSCSIHIYLGRVGGRLTSAEDSDIALTATDIGMGTGLFSSLKLIHLIPSERLQASYLLRIMEGISFSNVILEFSRSNASYSNFWAQKYVFNRLIVKLIKCLFLKENILAVTGEFLGILKAKYWLNSNIEAISLLSKE